MKRSRVKYVGVLNGALLFLRIAYNRNVVCSICETVWILACKINFEWNLIWLANVLACIFVFNTIVVNDAFVIILIFLVHHTTSGGSFNLETCAHVLVVRIHLGFLYIKPIYEQKRNVAAEMHKFIATSTMLLRPYRFAVTKNGCQDEIMLDSNGNEYEMFSGPDLNWNVVYFSYHNNALAAFSKRSQRLHILREQYTIDASYDYPDMEVDLVPKRTTYKDIVVRNGNFLRVVDLYPNLLAIWNTQKSVHKRVHFITFFSNGHFGLVCHRDVASENIYVFDSAFQPRHTFVACDETKSVDALDMIEDDLVVARLKHVSIYYHNERSAQADYPIHSSENVPMYFGPDRYLFPLQKQYALIIVRDYCAFVFYRHLKAFTRYNHIKIAYAELVGNELFGVHESSKAIVSYNTSSFRPMRTLSVTWRIDYLSLIIPDKQGDRNLYQTVSRFLLPHLVKDLHQIVCDFI